MKTIIAFLLSAVIAFANPTTKVGGAGKTKTGGTGTTKVSSAAEICSPPQGNLLNDEGFETATTGYQQSGWNVSMGTPDPAYSISGFTTNKPNGSCAQGFRSNYSVAGVFNGNSWDSGANNTFTVYVRFYIYVASSSISNANGVFIAGVFNGNPGLTAGTRCAAVSLVNNAGQLEIAAEGSTPVNISTGQWNLIELKVALNATSNGSEIKVNGGSAHTFTDTGYGSWRSIGIGTFSTSSDSFTFNDCIFDLVAADSTGYIGGTP